MRRKILYRILWVIISMLLLFSIYLGFKALYPKIINLGIDNIGSIITGVVTLSVGLGAVLITQSQIKKRELEEAHREKKIELYNRFNDKIFEILKQNKSSKQDNSANDLADFMTEFKKDLIFRASPKVIKSVIVFVQNSDKPNSEEKVLRLVDNIYRAMRKDIGLSNFGLINMEMIQIFLKNKKDIWKVK